MSGDIVRRLTGAVRVADKRFMEHGGNLGHQARDYLVPALDEAGLAVVDAELHRELVQAIRAFRWDQAVQQAIMRGEIDYFDPWFGGDRAALNALNRAVRVLDEKGDE